MKNAEECAPDLIQKAKRSRTNARSKFTRKCNAFVELNERGEQFLVLQDKFNDIRDIFKELDNANDRLIETINENAPHHVMDGMLEDCDSYMEEVDSVLDRMRAIYASCVSKSSSETYRSSQIHVKALDSPRFGGNIREYSNFKQDFTRLMVKTYGKDAYALRSCLYGPALQTVRGVEDDYDKMIERLDKVFGDSRKFVDTIISDIKSIKPIHDGDSKKFISMVDVIERCWLDLQRMDMSEEMDTVAMVSMIEKLLPPVQKREWIIHVDTNRINSKGMFEELLQYLLREKRVIEYTEHDLRTDKSRTPHPATVNQIDRPSTSHSSHRPYNHYAPVQTQDNQNHSSIVFTSRPWCWLHKTNGHLIENCSDFLKMTFTEKFEAARKFGACFNCLRATRHIAKNCSESNKCDVIEANQRCGRRHHPLLHKAYLPERKEPQASQISNVQVKENRPLLAATAVQCNKQRVTVMWDSGANISLITHQAAERLGLQGNEVSLSIVKVGGELTSYTTKEYKAPLVDLVGKIWIVDAYGIDDITSNLQRVDIRQVEGRFPGIDISKFTKPEGKIDMLIGVDFCTMMPTVVKTVGNSQLLENQFGFCIRGSFGATTEETEHTNATIRINHTSFDPHQDGIKRESPKHIVTELENFFEIESLGTRHIPKCGGCRCGKCITGTHNFTLREEHELQMIRSGLRYDSESNKFTIEYPWIKDPNNLPNNIGAARAKLRSMENRLQRLDHDYRKAYCDQMTDMEKRGVARKLSNEEIDSYQGPVHYIHYHEVIKQNSSSTPIRIVFNSSASYMGHVLNEYWAKGPDFINNLYGILLRFREYPVAITADISKMYNSIQLSTRDQHVHRYLWRDMDKNREPDHYILTAVPFGDRPSGTIALTALHTIAERFRGQYPEAAAMITRNSYVDDLVHSVHNPDEALAIASQVQDILASGNFMIKYWTISGQIELNDANIRVSNESNERILGMLWKPATDWFAFEMKLNLTKEEKITISSNPSMEEILRVIPPVLTRRMLLRQTATIFDPLGLIVPFTIQGKVLMRKLITRQVPNQQLDWDESIPEECKGEWITYLADMFRLNRIHFTRCLQPPDADSDPILIIFSDASSQAYGACAYARWKLKSGQYKTCLITAKSKISPNRQLSIPRLELCGAVLACRLGQTILKEMTYKFQEVLYVVDSMIVRSQIQRQSYGFGTFVATRIAEIQEKSSPTEWWWTGGRNNPADLTTRYTKLEELDVNSVWQSGPQFLNFPRESWPMSQKPYEHELPDSIVVNLTTIGTNTARHDICNDIAIENFSSYDKLIRVTARLLSIVESDTRSLKSIGKPLTVEVLSKAEELWIRQAQRTILENWQVRFRRLGPSLTDDGIIIVGSRIAKWLKENWNRDCYTLLPSNHPLTHLIVRKIHCRDHGGIDSTLAQLQTKFWVPGARRVIKSIRRECIVCRRLFDKPSPQVMGPVNPNRLKPSPAFHHTALDMFGPFLIKDTVKRRTTTKTYGVLFTCLSSRASYIDLVEGYSTQDFLLTLRRFATIRGYPATIYSDAGSQLTAASREIQDMTNHWNVNELVDAGVNHGLTWKFTKSADAPWENGCSESLIRLIKRALAIAVGDSKLTFSELQTVLFEVANILNQRPIGRKPGADPLSGAYLSPNDLLLGRTGIDSPQGEWPETSRLASRFLFLQRIVTTFWKKWYRDYFTQMIVRQKWHIQQRNFQVGDIVIVQEDNPARATWRMAEISKIEPSSDGLVRDVTLRYKPLTSGSEYNGRPDILIKRSTHRLILIIETDERTPGAPEPQRDPSVTSGPQRDPSVTLGPQRGGSVSSD
ncbi:uncharacterized protein LOC122387784 isoform X1 [Amphibalanus amphitrite]|uniref:uncharacterized protein LOC122387784 isoform X1 n=1 Tax=Amphibalanus amphitrite TaxID=1232801 RepID=UPI001C901E13|nr:uncharacterized protein LOC122387784 isoform X1 [Amphibalanus amphitrite]